jgi:hypothetical protein
VEQRPEEAPAEWRVELLAPLGVEAVRPQRLVLRPELLGFGRVRCEPQASRSPEGVAGQRLERVERTLGQAPEGPRPLGPELPLRGVVRRRRAAQREAAVAPARPARDLTGFVQAYARAALGQPERTGAPGDAASDDGDVDAACHAPLGQ